MTIMRTATLGLLSLVWLLSGVAIATEPENGQVQIPLDVYNQLVQAGRQPSRAPSGFALGKAQVDVRVAEIDSHASGEVQVTLTVDVLEDEWVLVPVLPSGTPVSSVTIDGKPAQLINTPDGLAWGINKHGSYSLQLRYHVDAVRSQAGFVLPIPTPEAAATELTASLPGTGLDVAVIPGAGVKSSSTEDRTRVTATIPATRGVQLS
jgi:hypothetical protein